MSYKVVMFSSIMVVSLITILDYNKYNKRLDNVSKIYEEQIDSLCNENNKLFIENAKYIEYIKQKNLHDDWNKYNSNNDKLYSKQSD